MEILLVILFSNNLLILYFIRHGQSVANETGVFAGQTDSPLSEEGKTQAKWLSNHLPTYDAIYSSTLSRAFETALISSRLKSKFEIVTSSLISERDWGSLVGKPVNKIRVIRKKLVEEQLHQKYNIEEEGKFKKRINRALCYLIEEMENNSYKSILVFSHGGLMGQFESIFNLPKSFPTIQNMDQIKIEIINGELQNINYIPMYDQYLKDNINN